MTRSTRREILEDLSWSDAEQPLCVAGCGIPVDNPGDYCNQSCKRAADRLADQAAEAMHG